MPWVPDLWELREKIIVFTDSEGKWWKVGLSTILFDDEAAGLEGGGGGSRGRGVGLVGPPDLAMVGSLTGFATSASWLPYIRDSGWQRG